MQQLRSLLLLPVPAGDTPCVKQAAVYTGTIARQQLTVLCYSKTARIPGGAPLEVQHRKRQKQRDVAKSRSDFFFLDEFLCSCYMGEPSDCCPFSPTCPAHLGWNVLRTATVPYPVDFLTQCSEPPDVTAILVSHLQPKLHSKVKAKLIQPERLWKYVCRRPFPTFLVTVLCVTVVNVAFVWAPQICHFSFPVPKIQRNLFTSLLLLFS